MSNLTQLRIAAREIFDAALRAVDPSAAVQNAVRVEGSRLIAGEIAFDISSRPIYSIAAGKAAMKMAAGLTQVLGDRLSAGVLSSNDAQTDKPDFGRGWQLFCGGHPEPNQASLAAAGAAFRLLDQANYERALIIFLISGGGSAMIELPAGNDISLSDLRAANKLLVNCGASISEINSARRTFSAVKGGKLAARAAKCDQLTLIVSDVPAGEEATVASGPTLLPPDVSPDPLEVIARYGLRIRLPPSIIHAMEKTQPFEMNPRGLHEHKVLLDNSDAISAALSVAHDHGFIAEVASDIADQPIEQGCAQLIERLGILRARHQADQGIICLISGGEFACPVRGNGVGGRSLETALRLALLNSQANSSRKFVALCAGTDGVDGNSPAAGAIIDSTTIGRARAAGLSADDFLERSDAYSFFVELGDAITSGPTGTNVRDLRILLVAS